MQKPKCLGAHPSQPPHGSHGEVGERLREPKERQKRQEGSTQNGRVSVLMVILDEIPNLGWKVVVQRVDSEVRIMWVRIPSRIDMTLRMSCLISLNFIFLFHDDTNIVQPHKTVMGNK